MGLNGYPMTMNDKRVNQLPDGFVQKKDAEYLDFHKAIQIIGESIKNNTSNCPECSKYILDCLLVHGGCCRDVYLDKVPKDVDIILDTQKLQLRASYCINKDCKLREFYNTNKDEYEKISKIKRYDARVNQWMTSDKVINAKYLLQFIDPKKTKAPDVVGIRDNSKALYVVSFVIYCNNGIDIDIMDNTFYFQHGFIDSLGKLEYVSSLDGYACKRGIGGWPNGKPIEYLIQYWITKNKYTQHELDKDIINSFEGSPLIDCFDKYIFGPYDEKQDYGGWKLQLTDKQKLLLEKQTMIVSGNAQGNEAVLRKQLIEKGYTQHANDYLKNDGAKVWLNELFCDELEAFMGNIGKGNTEKKRLIERNKLFDHKAIIQQFDEFKNQVKIPEYEWKLMKCIDKKNTEKK
eukprot:113299_1